MSFHKDPDAYTRGSGAIASSDYRNPRRARERRMRLAKSAMIDRNRAGYTYGQRGGMGATDALNLGVTSHPKIVSGGGVVADAPNTSGPMSPTVYTPTGTMTPSNLRTKYGRLVPVVSMSMTPGMIVDPGPAGFTSPTVVSTTQGSAGVMVDDGHSLPPGYPVTPATTDTPWYYKHGMSPALWAAAGAGVIALAYYLEKRRAR